MSSTICNDLDDIKAKKAVKALLKYEAKRIKERDQNSLMGGNAKPILVQFQLKNKVKIPVIRPVRVKIANSMFDPEGLDHSVCLFCRSADKVMLQEILQENPIDGLTTVVSIDQLKKNFKAFKERKELFSQHSHFICDNRIFSQLINLLGKVFSRRNNHPIPIDITNMSKFESAVVKSLHNSTYLHLSGQNITVRMGLTSMPTEAVVANVQEGIRTAVEKIGCGWGGILSVYIKSKDSPALPLHNSYANEMGEYVNNKIEKELPITTKKKEATTATPNKTSAASVITPKEKAKAAPVTTMATPKSTRRSPAATRSVVKKRALALSEDMAADTPTPASSVKKTKSDSVAKSASKSRLRK